MIKVIFFDVGGVLMRSDYDFDVIYRKFGKAVGMDPKQCEELHRHYLEDMLVGKCSARKFFGMVRRESGFKGNMKKIWVELALKHIGLDQKLVSLIDGLRSRYKIVMFSNVSEMRGYLDRALGLYSHFDRLFLSYKLKMKKPDPKMFEYAIEKMKLKPGESILVDDQEKNLMPAKEAGMLPVHFKNRRQLIADLKKLGVLHGG
jgi:putative hydrolase of the HAD superfamily